MECREQTKNAVFGTSIISLIVVSVKTTSAINSNAKAIEILYEPVFLTIIITSLFINVALGIFGAFIVSSLNSFLTKNLPNLIGAYQRIKIVSVFSNFS
ncbi:hypothetical protein NUSPORA_01233 [Nucleospora cyclopteri]